ncbi:unnamed protein product [Protopolystoma xenopodis]|uniref:Uncharacterized protein n=1 Tax=Protopolystoma xenopodis TaxID=117903 RepID=A0A3S5AQ91_9PLAT|nr:unnamed protein product [Protopolystoma xenopodis]
MPFDVDKHLPKGSEYHSTNKLSPGRGLRVILLPRRPCAQITSTGALTTSTSISHHGQTIIQPTGPTNILQNSQDTSDSTVVSCTDVISPHISPTDSLKTSTLSGLSNHASSLGTQQASESGLSLPILAESCYNLTLATAPSAIISGSSTLRHSSTTPALLAEVRLRECAPMSPGARVGLRGRSWRPELHLPDSEPGATITLKNKTCSTIANKGWVVENLSPRKNWPK